MGRRRRQGVRWKRRAGIAMLMVGVLGAGWLWFTAPRLPDAPLTPPRLFKPQYRSARAGRVDASAAPVARAPGVAERDATSTPSARVTLEGRSRSAAEG